MGILITPYSLPFANLSSTPTQLVTVSTTYAGVSTATCFYVDSLIVTNRGIEPILIWLRKDSDATPTVSIYWAIAYKLEGYQSANILGYSSNQSKGNPMQEFKAVLIKDSTASPARADSLTIYSDKDSQVSQKFDCEVFFSIISTITP